ncbi:MAG: nitrite/sulfite reductase [Betaproteobacteria bacterium]|nr:nitrite/sulfite reductase [Betaproteobacteria bacterium]MDH3436561.1 nitrite/sulfite reductase [Betaproteobacteria bacterium]
MYQYDQIDQQLVAERVVQYRDQTRRFLAGELSEDDFKPVRLQNGLYLQRYAPMLRVAIPYGLLSSRQLRKLAHIARTWDRGYAHFSTRQNLQFNWPKLEDVPDILAELATVQMHAIQTSGNCVRNITADHFAGVASDEIVDTLVWCEVLRQWSTFHPEFAYLPRKFKIAFNGSEADRAATFLHDIGLHATRDASGAVGFRVIVGGGMGRTPIIGHVIREFLPWPHLLTYLEAILRVYNRYGRRDNLYRARIKILVKARTPECFRDEVEKEWAYLKDGPATLTAAEIERVEARFTRPSYDALPGDDAGYRTRLGLDRAFAAWAKRNVHSHKMPGYAAVTLSLKKTGEAPGDATAGQMDAVATLAERYSFGEVRVSHEQNLILADVRQSDLHALWHEAKPLGFATPNVGLLTNIICCPGGDFCSLANAKSIPVAEAIQRRFDRLDYLHDIGELDLNISGCMNSCGHHHVGHIGILGVDKNGDEWYQISIGGNQGLARPGAPAAFGKVIGPSFARADVPDVIERLIEVYLERRDSEAERFIDVVWRIGIEPFKERIYGTDHQRAQRRERSLAIA